MRRVVIVGADFTPSSQPTALRIRLFAQHLREFGWEPIVLTTDPGYYETLIDPENEKLLPAGVEVIRTRAWPVKLTRKFGFGDLGLRSLWHHWRALSRLIRKRKIDVIFIPVPPNPTIVLGRIAHVRFGIPYVVDYQDPIASNYYWTLPPSKRPPKHALAYFMGRLIERFGIAKVTQIVGVSKGTTDIVVARYPWLGRVAATEIPLGGEPADFEYLRSHPRRNLIFDPADGYFHVSYIGAYALAMVPVVKTLFAAFARLRELDSQMFSRVRLHFVGTCYSGSKEMRGAIQPVATEFGLADLVIEHPARIPYLDALNLMLDSNALLLIGSVEPHYTASKIFPYILAGRPLLAIFHEKSSVLTILNQTQAGYVVEFGDDRPVQDTVEEIAEHLRHLLALPPGFHPPTRWEEFVPYTARAMAARLASVFNSSIGACDSGATNHALHRCVARPPE